MSRIALLTLVLSLFFGYAQAQILDPELGPRVWQKENTKQRDAVTLTHVREADAVWSTRIWQTIDMRQKLNQPLYFPVDSVSHGKRSFTQIIYDEIVTNQNNVGPNAIKIYEDWQLRNEYDIEKVRRFFSPSDSARIVDSDCVPRDTLVDKPFEFVKKDITQIMIMEDWFFDKQRSVMDVRILGLGLRIPIVTMSEKLDDYCQEVIFNGYELSDGYNEIWFFFPQLRDMMAEVEIYKRSNDAARLSFDDIFLKRMFTSYITKEENVFDRTINDYTKRLDALLEAERIKGEIFDFEQNLWEY